MSCGNHWDYAAYDGVHRRVIHRGGRKPTTQFGFLFWLLRPCAPLRVHLQCFPWLCRVPLYTASVNLLAHVACTAASLSRCPCAGNRVLGEHPTQARPGQRVTRIQTDFISGARVTGLKSLTWLRGGHSPFDVVISNDLLADDL
jgi:hypothetical protein